MGKKLFLSILFFLLFIGIASAQTVKKDSIKTVASQVKSAEATNGELVLDVIEIKGRVEKPGVIIMPKRVETDMGELALERSFKKEVREGMGEIPKPEKELRQLDQIKSIKKTVERKRK